MNSLTNPNSRSNDMSDLTHHVSEATAGIASKTSLGTGITAMVVGGIGLQDWLMIIGIVTTLGTFTINWYYQHKRSKVYVDRRSVNAIQVCPHEEDCDKVA